jgi:hypothetical protein
MKYKISNWQEKSWNDKKFCEFNAVSETGEAFDKVSDWTGLVTAETAEVEGEIVKNQKGYWTYKGSNTKKGGANMDRLMDKKATYINEVIGKKETSISHAQTRNEIMWAKYGACEIIAHHEAYKSLQAKDMVQAISKLANSIYHDQLQPFADTVSPAGSDYEEMNPDDIPW